MRVFIISALCSAVFVSYASAQSGAASPANCEIIFGNIELAKSKFLENPSQESKLIIVIGSPKTVGDKYDKLRIAKLTSFYVDFYDIPRDAIVWGLGPPSKTRYSYLKFYVGGVLVSEININPRSLLCTGNGTPLPSNKRAS